jgi:hypothetical protein
MGFAILDLRFAIALFCEVASRLIDAIPLGSGVIDGIPLGLG